MGLLDTYEGLKAKEAEAQVEQERINVLSKFAEFAAQELEAQFPGQWTQEDQAKLASALINMAITEEEEQEKVAEIRDSAKIFAREVWNELETLSQGQ